jgi:hypothetical protein
MGRFIYNSAGPSQTGGSAVDIDDRTLTHLRAVVVNKLRRGESFMFDLEMSDGSGRRSYWIHPAVPLQFHFYAARRQPINREWVHAMMIAAGGPDGLRLIPEPKSTGDPRERSR